MFRSRSVRGFFASLLALSALTQGDAVLARVPQTTAQAFRIRPFKQSPRAVPHAFLKFVAAPEAHPLAFKQPASIKAMYTDRGAETAQPDGPYRTSVTVGGVADLARLKSLGIPILAVSPRTATVLAYKLQLEQLAYRHFFPIHTDLVSKLHPHAGGTLTTMATARAIAAADSTDTDNDGLTNTEEAMWCTDPNNADSNNDGIKDGAQVQALVDWLQHKTLNRPAHARPFAGWPTDHQGCYDSDYDSVPDAAETFALGLNPDRESTANDRYDDGQKLFGVTNCPGSGTSCGYGALPVPDPNGFLTGNVPSWVRAPYDSPFVAAFPDPQVSVVPGSWHVNKVTVITTQQGQMTQNTASYSTSVTDGTTTSVANTKTWNNWQEISQAVSRPLGQSKMSHHAKELIREIQALTKRTRYRSVGAAERSRIRDKVAKLYGHLFGIKCDSACQQRIWGYGLVVGGYGEEFVAQAAGAGLCAGGAVETLGTSCIAGVALGIAGTHAGEVLRDQGNALLQSADSVQASTQPRRYSTNKQQGTRSTPDRKADIVANVDPALQSLSTQVSGVQYAINQQGSLIARGLQQVSYAISQPRITETRANGQSWGGAQTVTTEQSEEHTVTSGNQFTTGQDWSTATAVNSSKAAELNFTYTIANHGADYLRELTGLVFNIYLGKDPNPIASYDASKDFPAASSYKLTNMWPAPGGANSSVTLPSHSVDLNLDQMRRIDEGVKIRIVQELVTYGSDQVFYQNAINGGVTVETDDGSDGLMHSYVLPMWGENTVQDVVARFFPAANDDQGRVNSLTIPTYNPSGAMSWHQHALSDISWWHIYFTQPNDVGAPIRDLPAQAGSSVLIQFDRDSDRDGYTDRMEKRYGTDPNDASSHPSPNLLAGITTSQSGSTVTARLALQNIRQDTSTFPAYGISAVMYASDGSTTITDNTVGGNGVVNPGQQVAVGSLIDQPVLSNWSGDAPQPSVSGNYTGSTDLTYTFKVSTGGQVGQGTTAITWSDSSGSSGTLDLGSNYLSPKPIAVANGLQIALDTGSISAGASFIVRAFASPDTFSYTVNNANPTPPLVVVTYSDPQGVHQFVTSVQIPNLGTPLAPTYQGQMQPGLGVDVVSTGPLNTSGSNITNIVLNNPTPQTVHGARLHVDFISSGDIAGSLPYTLDVPQGPTVYPVTWSPSSFSKPYDPAADNILIATWTDAQGDVIASNARPLNTFAADPVPVLNTSPAAWNIGTVVQGAQLQQTLSIVNTGLLPLKVVVSPSDPSISLGSNASGILSIPPAGTHDITTTLDTSSMSAGPVPSSRGITIRSNDPNRQSTLIPISGTINLPSGSASAFDIPNHPLDKLIHIYGSLGQYAAVTFSHNILPSTSASTIEPCKVFDASGTTLKGVGRLCTDFGTGVSSSQLFGNGSDGDLTVPSGQVLYTDNVRTNLTAPASSAQSQLQVGSGTSFHAGDEVLIIQMKGSGAGTYEFATVQSVTGNSIILAGNLTKTYTYDGRGSVAQVIRVPHYGTLSGAGTISAHDWDGVTGGIVAFRAATLTGVTIDVSSRGFKGGVGNDSHSTGQCSVPGGQGEQGESWTVGLGGCSRSPNAGGGGGGGTGNPDFGAGGGGSYGYYGSNGGGSQYGAAGGIYGTADLSTLLLGSGGGGGNWGTNPYGGGRNTIQGDDFVGQAGGIAYVAANQMSGVNIYSDGHAGGNSNGSYGGYAGGGGSGGSIKIIGGTVALGSVHALGGPGGDGTRGAGGNGGLGLIAIQYCNSLTGGTNPTTTPQKLSCYIASKPDDQTVQLLVPDSVSNGQNYLMQFGHHFTFNGIAAHTTYARIPNETYARATNEAAGQQHRDDPAQRHRHEHRQPNHLFVLEHPHHAAQFVRCS